MGDTRPTPESIDRVVKAAHKAAQAERKKLVINFDQHYAEYRKTANDLEIVFEGRTFTVPGELGADVFTHLLTKGGSLTDANAREILLLILGDEFVKALGKSRAPFRLVISEVLIPILQHYGYGDAAHREDADPKDKTPG